MNGWSVIIIPMFRDVSVLSVYQVSSSLVLPFICFTNSNIMTVYSYYVFHVHVGFLLCKLFQDHCYYFSSGTEIDHHRLYGPAMGSAFASDRLELQ